MIILPLKKECWQTEGGYHHPIRQQEMGLSLLMSNYKTNNMSNQQFVRNEGLAESVSSPMRTETLQDLSADQIVQTILRIQERICQIENVLRQLGDIEDLHERMEQMEEHMFAAKEILTVKEAKEFLGISESQLYKLTRTLAIPHYKPSGKTIFFSRQEIIDWVKSRPARRRGILQENMNTKVSDETHCNDMEEQNVDSTNISNDIL